MDEELASKPAEPGAAFARLMRIIARLRDPNGGCPWDLEQTHQSLKQYLIEEAYEVVDAIEHKQEELAKELGDVLLQIALHSQIASEGGRFNAADVCNLVADKMIRRHPHVFGTTVATSSEQVRDNWEAIKQRDLAEHEGLLDSIPRSLPALLKAQRIGDKVARVGFDWTSAIDVVDKMREEIDEFAEAIEDRSTAHGGGISPRASEELGDLLFSLVQLARKLGTDCEDLLNKSSEKFMRRFRRVERSATRPLKELSAQELEDLWEQIKKEEE